MRFFYLLFIFILGCAIPVNTINFEKENQIQVINGEPAIHNEYPSIGALMIEFKQLPICTLTLIRPNIALTAGHCVIYDVESLSIAYGYDDADNSNEDLILMPVLSKRIHPDYLDITSNKKNDIALLLFDNSNSPVNIIFSNILSVDKYDDALNDEVVIVGYGQNIVGVPGHELYQGTVPIISRSEYEMMVGLDQLEFDKPPNACFGDSGGPAYVEFEGKRYVTGVTSRAPEGTFGCGHGAIYTLPGAYIDWIGKMQEEMLDDLKKICPECEECEECSWCPPPTACPQCTECESSNDCSSEPDSGCSVNGLSISKQNNFFVIIIFVFLILRRKFD